MSVSFEHCLHCKPPTRNSTCHSECPPYKADIAKLREEAAKKDAAYHADDDFLTARGFKTRRGRDIRRTKR